MIKYKNDGLLQESEVEEFLTASLQDMAERITDVQLNGVAYYTPIQHESHLQYKHLGHYWIDWDCSLDSIYGRRMENFPENLKLLWDAILQKSTIHSKSDSEYELHYLFYGFLKTHKNVVARDEKVFEIDIENSISEVYDYLCRDYDNCQIFAPLHGVKIKSDIISDNFSFLKNEFDTKIELYSKYYHQFKGIESNLDLRNRFFKSESILILHWKELRENKLDHPMKIRDFHLANKKLQHIEAVRLLGALEANTIFEVTETASFPSIPMSTGWSPAVHFPSQFDVPILEVKPAKDFIETWLQSEDSKKPLQFIVDRIAMLGSYVRPPEFATFDLVSILEGVLLGNEGELKFKFSIYGAHFASQSLSLNRRETFKLLSRAYKLRSIVAHCEPVKQKDMLEKNEIETLKLITLALVREAINMGIKLLRKKIVGEVIDQQSFSG